MRGVRVRIEEKLESVGLLCIVQNQGPRNLRGDAVFIKYYTTRRPQQIGMGKHSQRSKRLVDPSAQASNAVRLASLDAECIPLAFGQTEYGLDVYISSHDA